MEKEQSHLSRSQGREVEVGEGQGERELHLGEREGDQSGGKKMKRWTPQ